MNNRLKARDLGIQIGSLSVGKHNQITDVPGVQVGHVTLSRELEDQEVIQTGVTAVLPHEGHLFYKKVPAACYVLNGFGKTAGLVQVDELGNIEAPIMLTNTFGVGAVMDGTLDYMLEQTPEVGDTTGTINLVVGECNDSYLNSIRRRAVKPEHAKLAIENASSSFDEGAVGAGAGMVCFQYKGGIGSSSRKVEEWHVGVLVNSNFGRREEFRYANYNSAGVDQDIPDGSIMITIATDAPLDSRQLKRLSKRASVGLGRIGSHIHHGSGDIIIAFSNSNQVDHFSEDQVKTFTSIQDSHPVMNTLFQAVAEATEEAVLNSLTSAHTTLGRKGRKVEALPYELLKNH
ncbi:DmpA family aminopeptidase [Pontibacillus marinus]|uniref:D-aminopeptidase n=1 Tax=Pontibacillus marinus BH030004 = DSM 16465 TaxID=1385511 RepID=A0A0A5FZM2_9BACI|nr:P1 family peptidase [Pontibacillus marinus]KGX84270.1 D-aminopeptidase [Pontibacillus marinus BH030004 = DSM 16465]